MIYDNSHCRENYFYCDVPPRAFTIIIIIIIIAISKLRSRARGIINSRPFCETPAACSSHFLTPRIGP